MRLIARFTPLLCLLLLSCIEGREEVWLNRDGSGRLEASYRMPGVVMQQLGKPEDVVRTLQEAAARDEHVELTEVTHRKEKGFIILEFSGTFGLSINSSQSSINESFTIGASNYNLVLPAGPYVRVEGSDIDLGNYPIQTSFAMMHMPEVGRWSGITPVDVSRRRVP